MNIVVRRLVRTHSQAGQWGKMMSCLLALGWAIAFWSDSDKVAGAVTLSAVQHVVGRGVMALWMTVAAVLPVVALVTGNLWFRSISTTIALGTWLLLAWLIATHSSFISPAVWTAGTAIIMLLNAEYWLGREWNGR